MSLFKKGHKREIFELIRRDFFKKGKMFVKLFTQLKSLK